LNDLHSISKEIAEKLSKTHSIFTLGKGFGDAIARYNILILEKFHLKLKKFHTFIQKPTMQEHLNMVQLQ
jgi:hypothetical protein